MDKNAKVCWVEREEPWRIEEHAIGLLALPFNIDQYTKHPFCAKLKQIRSVAAKRARCLAIILR
jgi:hypothetical protein